MSKKDKLKDDLLGIRRTKVWETSLGGLFRDRDKAVEEELRLLLRRMVAPNATGENAVDQLVQSLNGKTLSRVRQLVAELYLLRVEEPEAEGRSEEEQSAEGPDEERRMSGSQQSSGR
jgi:hypothetical protein